MTVPDYFIADLPPGAVLTPAMIREACQTLKRNREHYLGHRPTHSLVKVLSDAAAEWLDNDYPFRRLALEQGPAATGFSRATLVNGLNAFFSQLTADNLHAWIVRELGHERRLDAMTSTEPERRAGHAALARGPELVAHVTAGNLPVPAMMSIVEGVILRSAQFVKCASGSSLLPRLFAHSLYQLDHKLCSCLEIAEWPGGTSDLEEALFSEADCVTATGSDQALDQIRRRLPLGVRFLGHGHRVSFAYLAREAWAVYPPQKIAALAAQDVAAWNQLGCLSPHVLYVETGGVLDARQFAASLAEALAEREQIEPRGELPLDLAATIAHRRGFYDIRAAFSEETRQWTSPDSTAWTVIYEADPLFQVSCLNRFIYVKSVRNLGEALRAADAVRGQVSTVGLAADETKVHELALELARWGVTRICPLGRMQQPPLAWRHDGRPSLADLVTWTDWEQSPEP